MKKAQFKTIPPRYHMDAAEDITCDFMADAFVVSDILVIDFYRKAADGWNIRFRTLIDRKEFWNFDYKDNTWNSMKLDSMLSEKGFDVYRYGTEHNLYISRTSRKEADEYIKRIGGYVFGGFISTIESKENTLAYEKRMDAEERKAFRIQEKMRDVPQVPEDFEDFIRNQVYNSDHFMYYDKKEAYCTRCGSSTERTKDMKHNGISNCLACGEKVRFKSVGRMSEHDERKEALLIQKWKGEVILRYFKCSLKSENGHKESLQYTESVRTYHDGEIKWYKKRYIQYRGIMGDMYWDDKMNPWHQIAYGVKTVLYPGNIEDIADTHDLFIRLPAKELADEGVTLQWKYMLMGQQLQNEIFEKLYKAGLTRLAIEYIRNIHGMRTNYTQRELKKLLLISKPMMQYMQKNNSGKKVLEVLQDAFKDNCGLNDSEIFELAENGILVSELKAISEKNKLIKMFHYLQNVKGYNSLRSNYQHYYDYVTMATSMNYNFDNGTVRYPKDLKAAHDKATSEFYEEETDKKKQKAMRENQKIKLWAEELETRYGFENKEYLIVPPKNAGEIIEEGRRLHHCVGGDNYLRNHNNGFAFILFMRKKDAPMEPYYTLEIDPKDNRIKQYYGKNDKKPDKKAVDDFLKVWKQVVYRRNETKLAAGL